MKTLPTRWTTLTLVEMSVDPGFQVTPELRGAAARGDRERDLSPTPATDVAAVLPEASDPLHELVRAGFGDPTGARGRGIAAGALLLGAGFEGSATPWHAHAGALLPGDADLRPWIGRFAAGREALQAAFSLVVAFRIGLSVLAGARQAMTFAAVTVAAVVIGLLAAPPGRSHHPYAVHADPDARLLPTAPAPVASDVAIADVQPSPVSHAGARR